MTAGLKSESFVLCILACTTMNTHSQTPAVILLSFVLAAGFLLVILSCALWSNWLPLLVGESTALWQS
jgi:hypothetical protein